MTIQASNISSTIAPRHFRASRAAFAIALLGSSSLLLACGGGSSSGYAGGGGEGGAGADEASGATAGLAGKPATSAAAGDSRGGDGGSAIVNCDERPTETVELNQAFWQTGFKVTLGTATLKPQTPSCSPGILTVDAQFENRGTETHTFDVRTLLSSASKDYELPYGQDLPDVPGGRLGKGSLAFNVDDTFSLDDAVLSFGDAGHHQAKVPLGKDSPDPLITLEPRVLPIKGKVVAGNLTVNFEDALVRADIPWTYSSLPTDNLYITLHYNGLVTKDLSYGDTVKDEAFVLQLPDGTSISPASASYETLDKKDVTVSDLYVRFLLPSPAVGRYSLEVREYSVGSQTPRTKATFPFALPSFPTFGVK